MDTTHARTNATPRALRAIGWLAVASMLALALIGPSAGSVAAAPLSGAIWTSLADGGAVNANLYEAREDVYLNGGPVNCSAGPGLPDGDYYFQVTDPSGATLLSSDAIKFRQVQVVGGIIDGTSGDGNHDEGSGDCGTPVQLYPFGWTPNPGGEYSVDLAPVGEVAACDGFDADEPFNFTDCNPSSKNDNFKVRFEALPGINVEKVADPTSLPPGGGEVTYTYTVTNVGNITLADVWVNDDVCGEAAYVSGDANDDDLLDLDETWIFECTDDLTETTTNTAVAEGCVLEDGPGGSHDEDICVTDDDQATVTVEEADPDIDVDKAASPTSLPFGGGSVTYTYTVTNEGNVPLSNVTVGDDKCSPVSYVSGDANVDTRLDLSETWIFSCTTTLTVDTTNTASAHGWWVETEVTDVDTAVVDVLPSQAIQAATATPSQAVQAATATPPPTPPTTAEGDGDPMAPGNDTWRLVLLALAGVLASGLVLTPSESKRRR